MQSIRRSFQTCARRLDGVLVAVDDSAHSLKAISYAASRFPTKRLDLVMVCKVPIDVFPPLEIEKTNVAVKKWHDKCVKMLQELYVNAHMQHPATLMTSTVTYGDPRHNILHKAKELDSDEVVVGSHGKGAIARVLLGSTAQYLANHMDRPLIIVR